MATIINNPSTGEGSSGILIGVVLMLVLGGLFIVFALPTLRDNTSNRTDTGTPTQVVPDKVQIDVNSQTPSGNQ